MNAKALVLLTITASFAIAATLQPAHLFKPSSNFFKSSDRSWLDRKATEALYKTKELIPEAITTPQKDDDQESTILSSMYRIVKQLITGSTRALEIVQNVKYLEDLPSVLKSKSTLFVIVSNGAPLTSRKLNDPIIRFGESSSFWSRNSRPAPVATKFFETVLVPKMNALALEFEKRIQVTRNHTFATVSIRAMPDELQVNDLLAIYSLSTGNLFIHPSFFDAMQHISNFVPLDSIDATFSQLRDSLPSKIFSIDSVYSLVAHAPLLLFSNFGMSLVCVACLAGLSLLTPFVLNYLLFELANVLCSTLQLQQEVCISVELGSLMLAYVMIYPAAMVIFYMCKRFVCAASGRFIVQY